MLSLSRFWKAGYPAICVATPEERRLLKIVQELFGGTGTGVVRPIYKIAAVGGLRRVSGGSDKDEQPTANYAHAWQFASEKEVILVVFDFHHLNGPVGYRPLLDSLPAIKRRGSFVILVAPAWNLPPELRHEIPCLELPLPSRKELESPLGRVVANSSAKISSEAEYQALLDAASGLALEEAESAFALAVSRDEKRVVYISREIVEAEKVRLIRTQRGLEVDPPISLSQLGGLSRFREWIDSEVLPHRRDEQLAIRSTLLIGPPGTGKSLASRVLGSVLGCPVLRLDLSSCRSRFVGQTEETLRAALKTADAVAPCILRIDEIDSALGGHQSSAVTDGGLTLGMLSILLTWMQERTSEVLLIAAANYPENLPPALIRAGRMDAIWAFDLPSRIEREEIARIHMKQLKCSPELAAYLADQTKGFSGAEIAGVVKTAARRSKRALNKEVLDKVVGEVVPLSSSRAREIEKMREWARAYARWANVDAEEVQQDKRQIRTNDDLSGDGGFFVPVDPTVN